MQQIFCAVKGDFSNAVVSDHENQTIFKKSLSVWNLIFYLDTFARFEQNIDEKNNHALYRAKALKSIGFQ